MKQPTGSEVNKSVGFTTKIRVNPRDVMSCIDCVNAVGLKMEGMSLSMTVSRGIAIALHTLRSNSVIPMRDGFEYSAMIAPYKSLRRVDKIAAGHSMVIQVQQDEVMDIPPPALTPPKRYEPTPADIAKGHARARILRRVQEMQFKKSADPLNWKRKDQAALEQAEKELVAL